MAPQISSEAALSRSGAVSRQGPASQVSRALTSSHKQQSVAHAYAVASIQQAHAGPPSRSGSSRGLSTSGSSTSTPGGVNEHDNIKVAVRLRPLNARELAHGDTEAVTVSPEDQHALQVLLPGPKGTPPAVRSFAFHACLGPAVKQADVLRVCGLTQLLDAALAGFHVTIMTYGQTGSGKTFTMSGREERLEMEDYIGDSDDGIVTRAVLYLYDALQKGGKSCTLRASYCEIYNEALYDLLHWTKEQLQVRWDAGRGFHVPGLVVKECATVDDMLNVISRGMQHRRTGSHELNMESSRSHSIMTVHCNAAAEEDDSGASLTTMGKINFVDLAGSERVKDTKAEKGMLKEASSINKSLFTLGKVISALAENGAGAGQVHVPYRDSKLTKLLMDSLGGSALALMVACCSPAASSLDETLSTLSYATRAKNIRNRPALQVDPKDAQTAALKREVQLLRAENTYLRGQLSSTASSGSSADLQTGLVRSGSKLTDVPPQPLTASTAAASKSAPAEAAISTVQRLEAAEVMLARYGHENERLAAINEALVSRRAFVDSDYTSAMDEVDWLKSRLEHLESTIVSQGPGSRGEPQGRPVSRRGRSGRGGSASEPSDQAALLVSEPGVGAESMAAAEKELPGEDSGAMTMHIAADSIPHEETEQRLDKVQMVDVEDAMKGSVSGVDGPPEGGATNSKPISQNGRDQTKPKGALGSISAEGEQVSSKHMGIDDRTGVDDLQRQTSSTDSDEDSKDDYE